MSSGHIFRAPHDVVIAQERSQLADLKKRHLITELCRVDVVAVARRCVLWSARDGCAACRGIFCGIRPTVGTRQITAPSRVCRLVVVVRGIQMTRQEDLLHVVEIDRLLGLVFGFRQSWQKQPGQNGNDGNDHQ